MTKDDEEYNKKLAERYEEYYSSDSDEVIEIGLKFKIRPRWYKQFIGFLQELENDSIVGHSGIAGFFADGDGDFGFRWTFSDDGEFKSATEKVKKYFDSQEYYRQRLANSYEGIPAHDINDKCKPEILFDAG